MSITLYTVKTRILRGKATLKKILEEHEKKEGETHG
jgi:RNA polymerase sigma-70 factor (ECF subfamily)